jgi:protein O-mannosyl-transferase
MRERYRGRGRTAVGAIALGALVLAAYIPALSAGYVWDDDDLLTDNPNVRTLEGLGRTWADLHANRDYYPLTHTSFWIEYHLWGLAPLGYHLDNILLHAANAVLVWLILRRLAVPGAWVAAAIFAVHPVQVEAVAWISERKSVLGGLFCLLSVWLFVRVVLAAAGDSPGRAGEDLSIRRRRLLYGLSLACFALALLARPVVMAAAAVLPLLVWYVRGQLTRRDVFRIAGYWVLAAAMAPVTIWVQYAYVGASGASFDYSILDRLLMAGRALWFYAGKLVWPDPLIFCYDKWAIDAGAGWAYLYPAGVVAVLAALILLRRRLGIGPVAGAMAFAIMLSPALGFFNVYWHVYYFVADHMQYLACAGLIAAAVGGAAAAARRLGPWARPVSGAGAAVLVGLLGALSWQQCGIYKDELTVWNDTLRKNPDSWLAHNNRGIVYSNKKDYDRAILDFDQAIRLLPDDARAYYNRGNAYYGKGRYEAAITDFDKAIELEPNYRKAHINRGIAYYSQGRYAAAIQDYDKAIELAPDDAVAYGNRGYSLNAMGRYEAAIQDYDKAIALKPDYAEAYNNRGLARGNQGQFEAAIRDYDKAIELQSDYAEAYNNRGIALGHEGRYDAAIMDFDKAIQLKTRYAEAYDNRGIVYSGKDQYDEAIKDFDTAIELKSDFAEAYNSRGVAYYSKGRYEPAIQDYDKAIELKPGYALAYNNRAVAHWLMKDYDKAWADVKMCRKLGGAPNPKFIEDLTRDSGRSP